MFNYLTIVTETQGENNACYVWCFSSSLEMVSCIEYALSFHKLLLCSQLFSTVCKLLAIFTRTFYIIGTYFYATLIPFGSKIKVGLL